MQCPWQPEEHNGFPGAEITGGCEVRAMGVGSQTQTLCQSRVCSSLQPLLLPYLLLNKSGLMKPRTNYPLTICFAFSSSSFSFSSPRSSFFSYDSLPTYLDPPDFRTAVKNSSTQQPATNSFFYWSIFYPLGFF